MDKFLLLFLVTFALVAGIFLLKIILRKVFSIQITSPLTFTLWFVLTIILGIILYTCFTEGFSSFFSETTLIEKTSFGRHRSPGSITAFIILVLLWLGMLWGSFEKIKPGRKPASSITEKVLHQIDDLYEDALGKNDFKALCKLVSFFEPDNKSICENNSKQAAEILEGTKYLLNRAEKEGPALIFTKEELEEDSPNQIDCRYHAELSSICITLGIMHKMGFGCSVNFNEALECFKKAETLYQKAIKNAPQEEFKEFQKSLDYIQKEIAELQKS